MAQGYFANYTTAWGQVLTGQTNAAWVETDATVITGRYYITGAVVQPTSGTGSGVTVIENRSIALGYQTRVGDTITHSAGTFGTADTNVVDGNHIFLMNSNVIYYSGGGNDANTPAMGIVLNDATIPRTTVIETTGAGDSSSFNLINSTLSLLGPLQATVAAFPLGDVVNTSIKALSPNSGSTSQRYFFFIQPGANVDNSTFDMKNITTGAAVTFQGAPRSAANFSVIGRFMTLDQVGDYEFPQLEILEIPSNIASIRLSGGNGNAITGFLTTPKTDFTGDGPILWHSVNGNNTILINAKWTPSVFTNSTRDTGSEGDMFRVKTHIGYDTAGSPGSITELSGTDEYEFITNSDGKLLSTFDLSGRETHTTASPVEVTSFEIPLMYLTTGGSSSTTEQTDLDTTIEYSSLRGRASQEITFNQDDSGASFYYDANAGFDGLTIRDLTDTKETLNDPHMDYLETSADDADTDIDELISNIEAVATVDSDKSLNDIYAIYKLAVYRDDIEHSNYPSANFDISSNVYDIIQLNQTVTSGDEYNVATTGTIELRGNNINAASSDTLKQLTALEIDFLSATINSDAAITINSDMIGIGTLPASSSATTTSLANVTLAGSLDFEHTDNRIMRIGLGVDVSEVDLTHSGSGSLAIFGKTSSDFQSVSNSDRFTFPFTETIIIDASSANEDVYYRILLDGNTQGNPQTFGSVDAGDTLTINLASSDYSHLINGNDIIVAVSGADVFAQQITRTLNGADTSSTVTLSNNPNYNRGGTVSTAVTITDDYDYDSDSIVFTIDAGVTLGGSTGNATFGSFKSTQHFADLISDVGPDADFGYPSTVAYRLNPTYHNIVTQETTNSTSNVALQGLSVTSGDVGDIITEGTFDGSGTVGVTLTADTAIDYGSIGAEVETRTNSVITAVNNARDFITDNDDDNFDAANGG